MGLSQLIAGPVSDALGRKKVLLMALLIQSLAVIGIVYASSITTQANN